MMGRRFFWGTLALFALKRHYRREVRPLAEAQGHDLDHVRAAAHRALDRVLDEALERREGE